MSGNGYSALGLTKEHYRIGEVSQLTDTKAFVLRYWETEFPMLQPVKTSNGHRLYRRRDVETVLRIKRLLYDEGFTIAGARRHLRDNGASDAEEAPQTQQTAALSGASRKALLDLRDALRGFLTLLESE
jgi:DNA-binding transcriptional MerR regulator